MIDIYGSHAVMQLDGAGPEGFWNSAGIANWLMETLSLTGVYGRARERGAAGKLLAGELPANNIAEFLEHGIRWTADVVKGQKTGFFLDQRENRHQIRSLARDCRVLNLFAYTGGFSVAAGWAERVTSPRSISPNQRSRLRITTGHSTGLTPPSMWEPPKMCSDSWSWPRRRGSCGTS